MLQLGRQGQHYVIAEVTQGTVPAVVAGNACRHKNLIFNFDNKNKRTIVEKKSSPFVTAGQRTDGRKSGDFSYSGVLRPSGTLNTLPEVAPYLLAGFGAKTNVILATTVAVGGAGTTTADTFTSATGLAVGDAVLLVCPDGKKRLRFLTAVDTGTGVATWLPALPAALADGAAVKGVITYKLTSVNIQTLSILHYLKKTDGSTAGLARAADMAGVDKLSLAFDANDDPMLSASGPCKEVVDPPAQPGGFTMVGSQPPSGITGDMVIGATAMPFLKANFELTNGLWLRNEDYGVSAATELYRKSMAGLSVGINARAETESILYDLTEAGTNVGVFLQTGYVEGNCMAVRAPAVEFKVPSVDDPEEEVNFDFKGTALESADAALDMIYFALG